MSRSMTGYARAERNGLAVSLKTVNHRGLDLHFHMHADLDPYEPALRNLLKAHIARGHVQVRVHLGQESAAPVTINRALLSAYLDLFQTTARDLQIDPKPDLNSALRLPGMLQTEAPPPEIENLETVLLEVATEALRQLNQFRDREGAAIDRELRERTATILQIAARIEEIRATAVHVFQQRLSTRLAELLVTMDSQRLVQEAALLADKSDVAEELMRLKTHAAQLDTLLAAPGEKGKKIDFLLQEMNRETNTILSKTGGLGDLGLTITDLALAAKSEIDKIREQSLNIE